jgi:cytochrome c oxidase subunit II
MKTLRIISGLVFSIISISLLSGCEGASSTLLPVTTSAVVITDLMWIILGVAAVVFVVVETLLIISILKHRNKGKENLQKDELPKQVEGNQFFETAWTIAPAIVLAIIFVLTLIALQAIINPPDGSSTAVTNPSLLNIRVTGHQWWWQFDYPSLKITTADEFHIPVDTVVMVNVQSADVIHSFWVPQFGGKIDVIPGHNNYTWFKATKTGVYNGQCSEYCGTEHAEMRFMVVVDTPEDYQTWVKNQQALPGDVVGEAATGQQLFMTGVCSGCHTIRGTNAAGKVGPDLTHLASRKIFSGGVLENTPENLRTWLANPPAVKPGTIMPNLNLGSEEITSLIAYLEELK